MNFVSDNTRSVWYNWERVSIHQVIFYCDIIKAIKAFKIMNEINTDVSLINGFVYS